MSSDIEMQSSGNGWASKSFYIKKPDYIAVLSLAYQSLGVVYGDLSTSPLYVYKCTFSSYGNLDSHPISEDEILGILSFIFWTLTLIPLVKYVFIVLQVDDNGEGGTFALYSLLCRHAKLSLLPNQQESDEMVSTYKVEKSGWSPSRREGIMGRKMPLLGFLENSYRLRVSLLIVVLLGTCMVIGDGVVTPSISVLSAVSGINIHYIVDNDYFQVLLTCLILVGLFSLQRYGTHRVAFLFAPIVLMWLISISTIGVYNTMRWNPMVFKALSPYYMYKFFALTGVRGWLSLGGIALCLTGSEAMFANLGHFSALSVKIAFAGGVYPCLVLSYMGQAAFLTKNPSHVHHSFYRSIPGSVYWPVVVVATLASIVASQSVISATFSIVNQCKALGCFPHVKVVHTSKNIWGQIYIPEINWTLMLLSLLITAGLKDASIIGNAYGLAVTIVMLVTTLLMSVVLVVVWGKNILHSIFFLIIFGSIEGIYFSASIIKVPRGGWVPLVLALIFMAIMCIWHYGTMKKYEFELENKVSMKRILSLGPSLGMTRVPGMGLVYSNLVTGIPGVFSHFITNIPAFHKVLVFVCVKSVPVPHVPLDERFLVGRIGPKMYRMFRCIVRYGYKDVQGESQYFEDMLVGSIENFIRNEKMSQIWDVNHLGLSLTATLPRDLNLPSTRNQPSRLSNGNDIELGWHVPGMCLDVDDYRASTSIHSANNDFINDIKGANCDELVRSEEEEEILDVKEAKEAGIAYLLGRSIVKASRSSSFFKRFIVNHAFSFLKENCRSTALAFHVPHPCLIQVGMVCYV